MGCTYSTVEADEVLGRCKERRRLMKQLLNCRAELAAAHLAYLQSLKNTGATLRQLTEVETMVPRGTPPGSLQLPPSPPPPPPLPPSPPPPPNFRLVVTKEAMDDKLIVEDPSDMDDDEICLPPPPPPPFSDSGWDFSDHLGSPASLGFSSPGPRKDGGGAVDPAAEEEEDSAETSSEIGEEEEVVNEDEEDELIQRKEALALAMNRARRTYPPKQVADDSSSGVSRFTKETNTTTIVWRSKKTLAGIVKELDDYFLKAAAGGKDVAVLLEPNHGYLHLQDAEAKKGKKEKSAKVVNALSWNWSFKSSHSNREDHDANSSTRPGTHCTTLEKIFAEEQKLYKQVKDEESATSQHKKVTLILQKLEAEEYDWAKTERALSDHDELQCRIISLKESINETCLSISRFRDEELFPQLIQFSVGLVKMWRTMYECHQVQNHVSQQANLLESNLGTDPTTGSHRRAISQLEAEVTSWYTSFCNLFRCQREYAHILYQWVRLTDCLPEINNPMGPTSSIYDFCEQLQGVLDRLPDKVAAEAIKSFLSVIRSIISQHAEEHNLQKRSDRLQSRLDKELRSLWSSDKHSEHMFRNAARDPPMNLPPSSSKHAKLEALKKKVEAENANYQDSIRMSRAMMLNNLQTSLPNVFQALTGFSRVFLQNLEGITGSVEIITSFSGSVSPVH
ncbi:hypothetical protein Cni_G26582 [Canna indica]|uniref:Nitrate regulatory gene2 protein n=1 Tax=Canna indica TaxID=4628 RepID=A0AAQ3QNI6_9LILI|nr:hypothetical protein Cni_G26582 [Canna indica]